MKVTFDFYSRKISPELIEVFLNIFNRDDFNSSEITFSHIDDNDPTFIDKVSFRKYYHKNNKELHIVSQIERILDLKCSIDTIRAIVLENFAIQEKSKDKALPVSTSKTE